MGFYGEDFFFSYVGHFFGLDGFITSTVVDRPFTANLAIFNYLLLNIKDNVYIWHIYALFLRLLSVIIFFFIFKKIWPNNLTLVTTTLLLFSIYPGYLQQVLPLGYSIYPFALLFWGISILLTTLSIKNRTVLTFIILTSLSVTFEILTLLTLEFFIGLEIFRLLIIVYLLNQPKQEFAVFSKSSILSVLKYWKYWFPYITAIFFFVFWRLIIYKGSREITDIGWVSQTYYSNLNWLLTLPLELVHSFLQTLLLAYVLPPALNLIRIPIEQSLISIGIGLLSASVVFIYLTNIPKDPSDKQSAKSFTQIGFISLIASLIPIIISGRFVRMYSVFDRYTITGMLFVAMIIGGFTFYKLSPKLTQIVITLICFISITSHLTNGFWHIKLWDYQQNLWWQLYWRSQGIKPNTMLILEFPPVQDPKIPLLPLYNKLGWQRFYWAEEQIWSAGNLFFNYNKSPNTHFFGDFLPDKGIFDKIRSGSKENLLNRNIPYTRDFSQSVLVRAPDAKSCLWIIDPAIQELPLNPSGLLVLSSKYSEPDRITAGTSNNTPPREIFGKEPEHNWCYYYQQASLARQLQNWPYLSQLTDEVMQKTYSPTDKNEWLPFIEGLITTNSYQEAQTLINNNLNSSNFHLNICRMLKRLKTTEIKLNCG